jgi:hypothetical protein
MKFAQFMSSTTGRSLRVVAGIALIVIGLVAGGGWVTLSVVGVVPLIAGLANVCLLAPLFHQPLKGH